MRVSLTYLQQLTTQGDVRLVMGCIVSLTNRPEPKTAPLISLFIQRRSTSPGC